MGERRQYGWVHGVLYALDQLANAVFRHTLRALGVHAAGYRDETLSSALGKSYDLHYVHPKQRCRWCRFFCVKVLTPAFNGWFWLTGNPKRHVDHCAESIEADEGMPPLTQSRRKP